MLLPLSVTHVGMHDPNLSEHGGSVHAQAFLVAHSLGGITVSFAMEKYPQKIQKAVFVTSRMPLNNQSSHTSLPPEVLASSSIQQLFALLQAL